MPSLRRQRTSSSISSTPYTSVSHHSVSSASTSATSIRSTISRKPVRKSERSQDVYVVGAILARSLVKMHGPDGAYEYRYLVRWEGYGPEDDTWEIRSNLMEGAARLVEAFDVGNHPFTILQRQGVQPHIYLVRYCLQGHDLPASPLAQEFWHTAAQMRSKACLSASVVEAAVRDYEIQETPGMSPRKLRLLKDRCILDVLDQYVYPSKTNKKISYKRYHVRYRDRQKVCEEWLSRAQMRHRFGEDAKAALDEYEGKNAPIEPEEVIRVEVSDYEAERLRNIEENRVLMKKLGL